MARIEHSSPTRVVFDSLSEMRLLAQDPLRYRRQVLALKQFFAHRRCTVLLLDDQTSEPGDLQLHSICHGVISLEQTVQEYGTESRRLRVVKMRGQKFQGGKHDFVLDTGRVAVFPRLVASRHRATVAHEDVSTGIPALDKMLGGGLVRGTSTLLIGPSGVGKTTTAIAACMRRWSGANGRRTSSSTKACRPWCCAAACSAWTFSPTSTPDSARSGRSTLPSSRPGSSPRS